MGSDSLFTKCKGCGKAISKSSLTCPQCGKKNKKSTMFKVALLLLGIFVFIFIFSSTSEDNIPAKKHDENHEFSSVEKALEVPENEIYFIRNITEYSEQYRSAKNELQQSFMRDQRKISLSALLNKYSVKSWVGTINRLETNNEGKGILSVRISPNIEIKTWNNALSDMGSNTLIEKESPVFMNLFDLSNGQKVKFSGNFIPSETDFIEETSITIDGSMMNPEFLFKFKSVTPIN